MLGKIEDVHATLYGNGQPGLVKEVEQIKVRVSDHSWAWKAIVLAMIGVMAAGISVHYSSPSQPVVIMPTPTSQPTR